MRWQTFAIVLSMVGLAGGAALADTGIPWVGYITTESFEEVSLFILPDGSGPPLTEARGFGGHLVDATIVVGLVDSYFSPIPNFPLEDIWLEGETTTLSSCVGNQYYTHGFNPDSNTDVNGETTFATSLPGGGWTEGPVWVYLNGDRATGPDWIVHPPVQLRLNSADISGDGQVNLADVAYFAENFFGEYHYRSDFYWDGVLNLSDLGKLAQGIGHNCE